MILLLPTMAAAAGETYTWGDTTHASIEATGGPYQASTEFTKTGTNTYSATDLTVNCTTTGTVTSTGPVTLTSTDGTNYTVDISGMTAAGGCTPQPFTTKVTIGAPAPTVAGVGSTNASGTCDQGSVSWIMCPVLNNLSNSISGLAKDILVPLLQVNVISAKTTPALYQAWQHIRDFANVLFILIFLVIIIGTMTEQDIGAMSRYHIKTIWPRLIIAAVLVQFSFFFSGMIIDIGNVLGAGIQGLIISITGPAANANPGYVIETIVAGSLAAVAGAGAIAVLASWTVAFPLILSLMISMLVGFLTLGARFLIIAILVVVSPLAMVAWVLPNTERYFGAWMKMLVRLMLMYPIVIGIISLAGVVGQILPFSGSTTTSGLAAAAVAIIKPLIAIAAFLTIPAAFRWAGKGMEQVTGMISTVGQKGKRGKEERKRRQASFMNQWMNSSAITSLQSKGGAGRFAASALTTGAGLSMLNAPKDRATLERVNSQQINAAKKELEELEEAHPGNLMKVQGAFAHPDLAKRRENRAELKKAAPNLYRIATTQAGQAAVAKRLSDLDLGTNETANPYAYAPKGGNIFRATNNPQSMYPTMRSQLGKETSKKPAVVSRITEAKDDYEVKNAAGTVVDTIPRAVGDLDITAVSKTVRRIKGNAFGDNHSMENFKVLTERGNANASMDQAAREMAEIYATEIDRSTVERAFDPSNPRSGADLEARITWMKGMQMNGDVFKAMNPELIKLSAAHLEADQDLTNNMLKVMGVDTVGSVGVLSATGRAHVVRDWMYGQNYDPLGHDYEAGGRVVI